MPVDPTCPSCRKRRARRACPALASQICAVCCGTKRQVEIACPADCPYLSAARHHPPAVTQRRREREGRFLAGLVRGLSEGQYRLFLFVQLALARAAPQAVPRLEERDLVEAAGALAATYETAAKGLIYEHQASALPAQRLLGELKTALATLSRDGRGPRDADVAVALRCTERGAREAAAELEGERPYLTLVQELFREVPGQPAGEAADSQPGRDAPPRLILP